MKMHIKDFEKDFEAITELYGMLKEVPSTRRHTVLQYVLELLVNDEKLIYQQQSAIRNRVADCLTIKRDDGVDA